MRKKKKEEGFTLVELMIVIAIIAVIAAVLVPNLIEAMKAARETKALEALSAYSKTQGIYQYKYRRYGTLEELRDSGYIDKMVADATTSSGESYQGFYFKELPASGWSNTQKKFFYQLVGHPQDSSSSDNQYLVNQAAKIWQRPWAAGGTETETRVTDPAGATPEWTLTGG